MVKVKLDSEHAQKNVRLCGFIFLITSLSVLFKMPFPFTLIRHKQ